VGGADAHVDPSAREIAPSPGGNISQCNLREKYEKEKRNRENVKEKGRKEKENEKIGNTE
jgi:hypothetical protein